MVESVGPVVQNDWNSLVFQHFMVLASATVLEVRMVDSVEVYGNFFTSPNFILFIEEHSLVPNESVLLVL